MYSQKEWASSSTRHSTALQGNPFLLVSVATRLFFDPA